MNGPYSGAAFTAHAGAQSPCPVYNCNAVWGVIDGAGQGLEAFGVGVSGCQCSNDGVGVNACPCTPGPCAWWSSVLNVSASLPFIAPPAPLSINQALEQEKLSIVMSEYVLEQIEAGPPPAPMDCTDCTSVPNIAPGWYKAVCSPYTPYYPIGSNPQNHCNGSWAGDVNPGEAIEVYGYVTGWCMAAMLKRIGVEGEICANEIQPQLSTFAIPSGLASPSLPVWPTGFYSRMIYTLTSNYSSSFGDWEYNLAQPANRFTFNYGDKYVTYLSDYSTKTVYTFERVIGNYTFTCTTAPTSNSILNPDTSLAQLNGVTIVRGDSAYNWTLPGGILYYDDVATRNPVRIALPEVIIELLNYQQLINHTMVPPSTCTSIGEDFPCVQP